MRRSFATLLGLVIMAIGATLMITLNHQNASCNATNALNSRLGTVCQHIVFSYMAGLGLIAGGFIVFLFSVIVMKKKNMRARRQRNRPIKLPRHVFEKESSYSGPL
jgi:hypothetical protein